MKILAFFLIAVCFSSIALSYKKTTSKSKTNISNVTVNKSSIGNKLVSKFPEGNPITSDINAVEVIILN